ncbi:MAG: tetratricopeptide repeat protein [Alphaproteobacteria bacterium]|nr:tetratricopeptide repeat protein [Alphaproteobacteria bacterium]
MELASPESVFEIAFAHHVAGRLRQAEELYGQVLQAQPDHVEARHLLGAVAHQSGRHEDAVRLLAIASPWRCGLTWPSPGLACSALR